MNQVSRKRLRSSGLVLLEVHKKFLESLLKLRFLSGHPGLPTESHMGLIPRGRTRESTAPPPRSADTTRPASPRTPAQGWFPPVSRKLLLILPVFELYTTWTGAYYFVFGSVPLSSEATPVIAAEIISFTIRMAGMGTWEGKKGNQGSAWVPPPSGCDYRFWDGGSEDDKWGLLPFRRPRGGVLWSDAHASERMQCCPPTSQNQKWKPLAGAVGSRSLSSCSLAGSLWCPLVAEPGGEPARGAQTRVPAPQPREQRMERPVWSWKPTARQPAETLQLKVMFVRSIHATGIDGTLLRNRTPPLSETETLYPLNTHRLPFLPSNQLPTVVLTTLDTSYEWNHPVCVLFVTDWFHLACCPRSY